MDYKIYLAVGYQRKIISQKRELSMSFLIILVETNRVLSKHSQVVHFWICDDYEFSLISNNVKINSYFESVHIRELS